MTKDKYWQKLFSCFSFIAFLFMGSIASGQNLSVSGTVTTFEDGHPLPGLNVIVKGTSNGVQTDFDGNYTIKSVSGDATLVFSYLGFITQEVPIDNRTIINVALKTDQESLDEVVVIGYGTVKKSDLTGAVSSVKGEQIEKSTGTSIENAMQGRMAGVKITSSEGTPGSGLSINVRGTSSINGGSDPLYVIDGVPVVKDNNTGGTGGTFSALPSDPLSGINPQDIASIEVLKDASATAIYGSRGANGVVLITTKQGTVGKLAITYDGSYGISNVSNKLDLLNARQYYQFQYYKDPNQEIFTDPEDKFYIDPANIASAGDGIDWQDATLRQAQIESHNFGFRGGSKEVNYYISLGYFDQEGVIVSNGFERYSGLANINIKSDRFRLHARTNFSQSISDGSVYASGGPNNSFAGTVNKIYFSRPLGTQEDIYNFVPPDEDADDFEDFFTNPYLFATTVTNDNVINRITGNFNAFYNLTDHFEVQARLGGSIVANNTERYFPAETTSNGRRQNGYAQISHVEAQNFAFENLLHYQNKWGRHNFNGQVGYTFEKGSRKILDVSNQGFILDDTGVYNIGVGTDLITPQNSQNHFSLNSYLARFNYNYGNRYLFTLSGRADGSSKFPKGNKYAFFPSGAVSWNASNEKFLKDLNWLSNLKFRYSLGASGNQAIPTYQSLPLLSNVTYPFGGARETGYVFGQLENLNLQWETSIQNNIGLDLGLFNYKINLTAEAYRKITKDVLLNIPLSAVVGSTGRTFQNAGEIENRGLEFSLKTHNIHKSNFSWNTNFNISFLENRINSLGEISQFFVDFGPGEFSQFITYREGGEIGEFYGFVTDGILRTQEEVDAAPSYNGIEVGSWRLKDLNGDGIVNNNDRTVTGSSQPDFYGGLTNEFTWGNFDLSVFFEFSGGQDVYNANRALLQNPQRSGNKDLDYFLNAFRLPITDANGDITDPGNLNGIYPAPGSAQFTAPLDEFVEDASYIRLANVNLGFNVPVADQWGISNLKLSLSGNNLFVWTNYTGFDPDVNTSRNNGLIRGVDFGAYPRNTNYSLGVNIKF